MDSMEKTKMRNRPRRAMVRGMDGVYHLLSRTSCRQYLFGDEEKEMFVRLMRRQADSVWRGFCSMTAGGSQNTFHFNPVVFV